MQDYTWFERGHVAIVTGASKGLGRAIAGELARAGISLVIDARGADALTQAERELSQLVPVATSPMARTCTRWSKRRSAASGASIWW